MIGPVDCDHDIPSVQGFGLAVVVTDIRCGVPRCVHGNPVIEKRQRLTVFQHVIGAPHSFEPKPPGRHAMLDGGKMGKAHIRKLLHPAFYARIPSFHVRVAGRRYVVFFSERMNPAGMIGVHMGHGGKLDIRHIAVQFFSDKMLEQSIVFFRSCIDEQQLVSIIDEGHVADTSLNLMNTKLSILHHSSLPGLSFLFSRVPHDGTDVIIKFGGGMQNINRPLNGFVVCQLLSIAERVEISGIICATTVTTIHYLSTKVLGKKESQTKIKDLMILFEIASVNRTVIENALNAKFTDFEDSVIHQAANHAGAEAIVTRDPKGFKYSIIPVYRAVELLNILQVIE